MSIAYLVLAYNSPRTLSASVQSYKLSGGEIFVHVDSKISLSNFISDMGDAASLCIFIEERHSIFWAGYTMIEATLSLIDSAQKYSAFHRFVLVSDDTIPIRSPKVLKEAFCSSNEYISVRLIQPSDPFMKRYERFYFFDHPATSLRGRPIENSYIDEHLLSILDEINSLRILGKEPIDLYYGSQWWALTNSAINFIQDSISNNRTLRDSFRFTAVPDEMYFQSIIMNSILKESVRSSVVHVDWTKSIKPHVFSTLNEILGQASQFDLLARKVNDQNQEIRDSIVAIANM